MANTAYQLLLQIGGKLDGSFGKAFSTASKSMEAMDKASAKTAKSFNPLQSAVDKTSAGFHSLGGVMATAAGALGVTIGFGAIIDATSKTEDATSQLNTVLASTHGVAGVTSQAAQALASSLSGVTTYGRNAVLGSENMLLTFTKIGSTVMPQATEAVLNMSTALGQDTKSSAMQLGKALNDPLKGITALQRVGVSFTEQQKKQIQTMVKVGDTAGAQKLILAELGTEFGGSAKAAGQTFSGQMAIIQNKMTGAMATIGLSLMPMIQSVLPKLMDGMSKLSSFITNHQGDIVKMGTAISNIGKTILTDVMPVAKNIFNFITQHGEATKNIILGIGAAFVGFKVISGIIKGITLATQIWSGVTKAFTAIQAALNFVMNLNPIALVVLSIGALTAGLVLAYNKSEAFRNVVDNAFKVVSSGALALKGVVVGAFEGLWNGVKPFINLLIGGINFLIKGLDSIQIPKITLPGIGTIGGVGINIPQIPQLKAGGIVSHRPGGILANIGEGSYDEAVVPLKPGSGGAGGGGMQITYAPVYHIGGSGSIQNFKQAVEDAQRDFARQMTAWQANNKRVSFA